MKLLSQFNNRYNNIKYKLYILDNGIHMLHLINPSSIDIDFSIVVRAGSAFEKSSKVPIGTAHFLEHMLLNPNSIFKSREDIDAFERGNPKRPSINMNAATTRKYIYLTGHSNRRGFNRILERMESMLDFPKDIFSKQMEKERGVILAEKSRKPKRDKDAYLCSLEYLFKDVLPEFTPDVLGESKDINSIKIEDLEKYFKDRFVTGNTVFALQTGKELNKEQIKRIYKISKRIPKDKGNTFRNVKLSNKWDIGYFKDDRASGVFISFIYLKKEPKVIDYRKNAIEYIFGRLISWLSYDILREKLSLIYDLSPFNSMSNSFGYSLQGFKFVTEKDKVERMLDELYILIHEYANTFLDSKKGVEWFEDVLSGYIYPRTVRYDPDIAESSVIAVLEGDEIFNQNISVDIAKGIKIEDIKEYLNEWRDIPPHIWVETDIKDGEIVKLIQDSKFGKRFNSRV